MSEPNTTLRLVAALKSDLARRLLALLVLALGTGALVGEYAGEPVTNLKVGGVAERSVRATANFPFIDREATQERQRAAAALVKPVFDFDTTLGARTQARIQDSFEMARNRLSSELDATSTETDASIRADFEKMLDLVLSADALERLSSQRYSKEIEGLVKTLVGAEIGRFTIAERSLLPSEERPISVIRILQDSRDEITLDGFSKIVTPAESRRAIKMAAFDVAPPDICRGSNGRGRGGPSGGSNQLLVQPVAHRGPSPCCTKRRARRGDPGPARHHHRARGRGGV